jgi:hypothetical protein
MIVTILPVETQQFGKLMPYTKASSTATRKSKFIKDLYVQHTFNFYCVYTVMSGNEMERKKWFVQLSMISSDNSQDREKELPLYSQLPVSTFTFSLSIF